MIDQQRRDVLKLVAALVATPLVTAGCAGMPGAAGKSPVMDARTFDSRRRYVELPAGRIAYVEQGAGPVVLFLHGVPLNGFHWRHIMAGLSDMRRGIAPDLMGLGHTDVAPGQDVSFAAQARMLVQFLDALDINKVDLVGNDSGGGVAQIFAANNPQRLRTLTLTNCDAHDNYPHASMLPIIELARQGRLGERYRALLANPDAARARFAVAYADPSVFTDEVMRAYLEPVLASERRTADFQRYWAAFDPAQTVAIEPQLRTLRVPTLIVWALDDRFFDLKWAQWLHDTIPGAVEIVKVPNAKLFFPEDRPQALIDPLRGFLGNRSV